MIHVVWGYSSSWRIRQDLISMRKFVEKMNKEFSLDADRRTASF
jgi:hypothetical protein